MPLISRRSVVACKLESVEGTAETLAAADASFLVMDPKFQLDVPMFKRTNLHVSMSDYAYIPGTQGATLSFKVEVKGSGTAGAAPALGKLLKACGFGETVVAVTSVTYAPVSASIPSCTVALYRDGIKKQMRGARANVKLASKVGEPLMLEFEFKGVYDGVTDVALLSGTGIETTVPPAMLAASLTVQAFAAKISALSLDMGNKLALRTDISKAEGFFSCLLTARDVRGSMDPEQELVATHDFTGRMKAGTLGSMSLVVGATAGNICTLTAPKVQYMKLAEGDRDGIATLGLDFSLVRSAAAGDDEVVLAFT